MHEGRSGLLFRAAELAVTAGLSTRLTSRWRTRHVHDVASVLYLAGALAYRYAWVEGGKASAAKHSDVGRDGPRHPLARGSDRGAPGRADGSPGRAGPGASVR